MSLETLTSQLRTLGTLVESAESRWKPLAESCDSEWIAEIEALRVKPLGPVDPVAIEAFETESQLCLPEDYRRFLEESGAFEVGSPIAPELRLRSMSQLGATYGELIRERIPDHTLSNFSEGHYDDFLLLAEYGVFPQQIHDDSDGLAFNRKHPAEIIRFACDEIFVPSGTDARLARRESLLSFLADRLQRLVDRATEAIEGLDEEIAWYLQKDSPVDSRPGWWSIRGAARRKRNSPQEHPMRNRGTRIQ